MTISYIPSRDPVADAFSAYGGVTIPVRPLNERLLSIVFKDGPLTDEERALLDIAERSAE